MQLEKYGDVVDSLHNMKANNIISEYSEFVVQSYDTCGGPTRKNNDLFLGVTMGCLSNFQFSFLILTYCPGEQYQSKYRGTYNLSNVSCRFDLANSSCCVLR